ncbi:hypothetical protein SF12_01530 [Streptomyces sp. MBRL 601]|nr:hypothetical protein SF12_01530 [Streptomyces sp. MBRL 601]
MASTAPGRSSGKPARMRAVSLYVQSGAPRVGSTVRPSRRSSTRRLAESGVWLSKNSQFTITTGA